MNTRPRVEALINKLNQRTLGTDKVEWNTPRAFHLTSAKPGARRIYAVERNAEDPNKSGVQIWHSGYIREVYDYMIGLHAGLNLGLGKEI